MTVARTIFPCDVSVFSIAIGVTTAIGDRLEAVRRATIAPDLLSAWLPLNEWPFSCDRCRRLWLLSLFNDRIGYST